MALFRSHNPYRDLQKRRTQLGVKERIRENNGLQWFVLIGFYLLELLYIVLFILQLSSLTHTLAVNTELFDTDMTVHNVMEYEVNTDGELNFILMDGTRYEDSDAEFVFVENRGYEEAFYSEDSNALIVEVSEGYSWEFMKGQNYPMLLLTCTLLFCCFLFVKGSNWTTFSKRPARVISGIGLFLMLFAGFLAVVALL